jgi:predicted N-acetyltransferase YhbS
LKFRNYKDGDEHQIVELLNQVYNNWGTVEEWCRKYKLNPNFDPRLIFVCEDKDKIVGCVHYLRRDLKFNNNSLHAYIGGDGATLPAYSGRGVFSKGMSLLYREVKRRRGSIIYGFNSESIYADFYRRKCGEVAVYRPHVLIKILDFEGLISSILPAANRLIGRRIPIKKTNPVTLRLLLDDKITIDLCISGEIKLCKILSEPDITVKTRLRILSDALSDERRLLAALVLRRISLKISGSSVPKLVMLMVEGVKRRR